MTTGRINQVAIVRPGRREATQTSTLPDWGRSPGRAATPIRETSRFEPTRTPAGRDALTESLARSDGAGVRLPVAWVAATVSKPFPNKPPALRRSSRRLHVTVRRPERDPREARGRTSPCGSRHYRTVRRVTELDASDEFLGTTSTFGLLCRTARRGTVAAGQSLVRLSTPPPSGGTRDRINLVTHGGRE